jgi:zinc and cadmium transporter
MPIVWIYAIVSVVLVSLVSLIGALTVGLNIDRLKRIIIMFVALSAGALFGDVFFHLIPEVFKDINDPVRVGWYITIGILLFFVLEKFLHWHHSHDTHECVGQNCNKERSPLGSLVIVSDGLHNLIDGLIIGTAYLVSIPVGVATTLAVVFHEIPQEIGDFGILIHSGFTRTRALVLNLLSGLVAVVGTVTALLLGSRVDNAVGVITAIAIGGFLYIAGSDLVPELHKTNTFKSAVGQFLAMFVGMFIMYLLLFLE